MAGGAEVMHVIVPGCEQGEMLHALFHPFRFLDNGIRRCHYHQPQRQIFLPFRGDF